MLQNLPRKILNRVGQKLLDPLDVLQELDIRPNWHVLELGLPVGFFAKSLHNILGDEGSMTIAGPNRESLEKLQDEIEHRHTQTTTLAEVLSGKATQNHSMDLILLTNLLSNAAHADNFCLSLANYLKLSGKVAVIDWELGDNAPFNNQNAVTRERAIALLQKCGFEFERLLNLPGYHFGLVFRASLS